MQEKLIFFAAEHFQKYDNAKWIFFTNYASVEETESAGFERKGGDENVAVERRKTAEETHPTSTRATANLWFAEIRRVRGE